LSENSSSEEEDCPTCTGLQGQIAALRLEVVDEQERADVEKRRADEQQKRADEEQKRADEQQKRADEQQARVDDYQYRAEELQKCIRELALNKEEKKKLHADCEASLNAIRAEHSAAMTELAAQRTEHEALIAEQTKLLAEFEADEALLRPLKSRLAQAEDDWSVIQALVATKTAEVQAIRDEHNAQTITSLLKYLVRDSAADALLKVASLDALTTSSSALLSTSRRNQDYRRVASAAFDAMVNVIAPGDDGVRTEMILDCIAQHISKKRKVPFWMRCIIIFIIVV
jgi:chromosome segregation ATPase